MTGVQTCALPILSAANVARDYEAKIEKLNFDTKLDKALTDAKAKNPKTVKALLNLENLKLDGEDIIGLKEQLEALKTLAEAKNEEVFKDTFY